MKSIIVFFLRALIVCLVVAPLVQPTLEREIAINRPLPIALLASYEVEPTFATQAVLKRLLMRTFGSNITLEWKVFGAPANHPVEDFEELGSLIGATKGTMVILAEPRLWGPPARKFNDALKETEAFKEGRIHWLPGDALIAEGIEIPGLASGLAQLGKGAFSEGNNPSRQSYLGLSEVFLPKMSFLGEESIASVEITGRLAPNAISKAEIVLRAGDSLLTSKSVDVVSDSQGVVNQIIHIPVHFVRANTQILTANLNSEHAAWPLDSASTTVSVLHSKTTLLHIAVGPDWSLRSLRQKLKFWPNLDLLSYYILREAADDMSIPSSQLSLIEFPAEKLFGTELPNFHGVVAQNFSFDQYLNPKDSENLINYVKNGGRMTLLGGPLSFQSQDPNIMALSPCENVPEFDFKNTYHWEPGQARMSGNAEFGAFVKDISSRATAINCKPKEEAIVFARSKEGAHPMVLAMPLQKGLILTIMSGDWHTAFAQTEVQTEADKAARVVTATAVEDLFQWMVEFLQRRQDSGLRPPDLAGPRIYAGDTFFPIRARGALRLDTRLELFADESRVATGQPFRLSFLETDAARFEKSLVERSGFSPLSEEGSSGRSDLPRNANSFSQGGADNEGARSATPPSLRALHIQFDTSTSAIKRPGLWPVYAGNTKLAERLPNPVVFKGIEVLKSTSLQNSALQSSKLKLNIPLLEAYPFLLAVALALLALEQFLTRILWRSASVAQVP